MPQIPFSLISVPALALLLGAAQPDDRLRLLRQQTLAELHAGRVSDALTHAQSGYDTALRARDPEEQMKFLLMIANARQMRSEYAASIAAYRNLSTLATTLGNSENRAIVATSLASLFARLGQLDLADAEASRALSLLGPDSAHSLRSQTLRASADIKWSRGDYSQADELFLRAIDEAGRDTSPTELADAWSMFGFDLLLSNRLAAADVALTEAYRLRRLFKLGGLDVSYRNLGMLRLRQGDPKSALVLLNRAVSMYESRGSRIPGWSLYYRRAQARNASVDLSGAFSDLGRSLDLARRWRAGVLPAEESQTRADIKLDAVYSEYVNTGMKLWHRNRSRELLALLFVAVQENRAASLRQDRSWRANLPPEYWEALAQSRRLEIAALAGQPEATPARLRQTHIRLLELENSAGLFSPEKAERIPPNQALTYFQKKLRPGEALVSFQVGESESFAWVLTPVQLEVSRLPGRQSLAAGVRQLNGAIAGGQDCAEPAARLYELLFGQLAPVVEKAPDWILSLDGELFDLPFAALRGRAGFVAERHSIRTIPSAFALDAGGARTSPGRLLGIGDPIYNAADTRWQRPAQGRSSLELPRLAASATEISEVAKAWKTGPSTLLTGRNATRPRIDEALKSHPAAVHFAVHVVPSSRSSDQALMAIGLDSRGVPDFYTPEELAARKLGIPLVVLSACNSGGGAVLPGAGRMGLTRAWLISGAQAVVASLWPTPDESGAIFASMYRNLGVSGTTLSSRAVAKALRAAQAEMISSRDWRSQPRYWATFFLVGRD